MKLAICDDEKRIRDMIAACAQDYSGNLEIECFEDAKAILAESFQSDILFLDIQMPVINGMQAAKILRSFGKKTVIVFVTALEEEVFHAFDVDALGFIVKPFDEEKIKNILQKAINKAKEQSFIEKVLTEKNSGDRERTITVKSGGSNTRVIISEIVYAEIFDRRIILHMNDGNDIAYYGRISDLETLLGTDFYRVHRAYLIHLAYIRSYDSRFVNVKGEEIPVARGKYQQLIRACLSYHTRREGL